MPMIVWSSKLVFYQGRNFCRKMFLQASATSRNAEDWFLFRMPRFLLKMFVGLKMLCGIARV